MRRFGFTQRDWSILSRDRSFGLFLLFRPKAGDVEKAGIQTLNRIGIPALP